MNELISENYLLHLCFDLYDSSKYSSTVLEFRHALIELLVQEKAMFSISRFEGFPGRRIASNGIPGAL